MNNDLISREALKKEFEKVYPLSVNEMGGVVNKQIYDIIDNAPTVEIPTELCKGCRFLKDCETCEEKLRPQGEYVEKYEKILQIVEHWNDKSSSFVSACEAFEKILDVTKGGAE